MRSGKTRSRSTATIHSDHLQPDLRFAPQIPQGSCSLAEIMAADSTLQDPLLALRRAIAAGSLPTPTTTAELSDQNATGNLAEATHLYFSQPSPQSLALNTPTRFVSAASNSAVDLRSIFFAWQKKDVAIPEYIASAQEINEALKQKEPQEPGKEEVVQNLVFVERLELITYLEGAADESEYIKPLEGAAAAAAAAAAAGAAQAEASAGIASGTIGGVPSVPSGSAPSGAQGGRPQKPIDPRLQEIYNGERKTGDRNSVLRGIKQTVGYLRNRSGAAKKNCFHKLTYLLFSHRTSLTFEKALRYSSTARALAQASPEPNQAPNLSFQLPLPAFQCPRHGNPTLAQTPSSCYRPPPLLSSACPTSSHSSRTASLCHRIIPHSACQLMPTLWSSDALSALTRTHPTPAPPLSVLIPPAAGPSPQSSFLSMAPQTSSPSTGLALLLFSRLAKLGNSSRTNGHHLRTFSNMLPAST